MSLAHTFLPSPVGPLKLVASDVGLAAVLWDQDEPGRVPLSSDTATADHPILVQAARELNEYFAGDRQAFSVPLDETGTHFQKQVWAALRDIPFGETRSYGDLAKRIGNPAAVRAVGAANGRNPISIISPCHRVIGSTGKLTGFAGGLDRKAFLLALEARQHDLPGLIPAQTSRDGVPPYAAQPATQTCG